MKKVLSLIIALLLLASVPVQVSAEAPDPDRTLSDLQEAICRNYGAADLQTLLDGPFCEEVGTGEAWYVLALRQLYPDSLDYTGYREALEVYVPGSTSASPVTALFNGLTLLALESDSPYIHECLNQIGELGLMSWVFGLHLLNNGAESAAMSRDSVTEELLSLQLADGGWAIMGQYGDPDATAMTLQALACQYGRSDAVTAAADRALAFLSDAQLADGNYRSFGNVNPESAGQVLTALSALGIDGSDDPRFVKNGISLTDALLSFRLEDGSFSHEVGDVYDESATREAFYSLAAFRMSRNGQGSLFLFDTPLGGSDGYAVPLKAPNLKLLFSLAAVVLALVAAFLMFLCGKRNPKSYIPLAVLAAAVICCINFISIQKPEDYYGSGGSDSGKTIETRISIRFDTVAGRKEFLPADGVILQEVTITVPENATAYEQLVTAAREYSIQLESEGSSRSAYVSGISYLYEYEFGDLSGWLFRVNGVFSDRGLSQVHLKDGDLVEWLYTTDLGKDVGNTYEE